MGIRVPFSEDMGESDIIDELRVIINDEDRGTAYFTFSSQMRPGLHGLRIFGPKNGIIVDHDEQTVIKLKGNRYKSYLEKFVPPYVYAGQYVSNALTNLNYFLKRDFHMKTGMKFLIESFYRSIREEDGIADSLSGDSFDSEDNGWDFPTDLPKGEDRRIMSINADDWRFNRFVKDRISSYEKNKRVPPTRNGIHGKFGTIHRTGSQWWALTHHSRGFVKV